MYKNESQSLAKLDCSLSDVRDLLLELSRLSLVSDEQSGRLKADSLFDLAKETDSLRRRITAAVNGGPADFGSEGVRDTDATSPPPRPQGRLRRKVRGARKRGYPKFFRHADSLVKVGWSKGKKREYRHAVPRGEYERMLQHLGTLSRSENEFTAEDLVSACGGPSYQTYIVLSLLRHSGLLQVPRRGVLAFSDRSSFVADAEAIWQGLAKERGERVNDRLRDKQEGDSEDE